MSAEINIKIIQDVYLHHFFTFRDGRIAYYRGTEDTEQTAAVLRA